MDFSAAFLFLFILFSRTEETRRPEFLFFIQTSLLLYLFIGSPLRCSPLYHWMFYFAHDEVHFGVVIFWCSPVLVGTYSRLLIWRKARSRVFFIWAVWDHDPIHDTGDLRWYTRFQDWWIFIQTFVFWRYFPGFASDYSGFQSPSPGNSFQWLSFFHPMSKLTTSVM